MIKVKDKTYRGFACISLILGVVGMCGGMITQIAMDLRELGPLPAFVPLIVFSVPSLLYYPLYRIGVVDGYYTYDAEELDALNEMHKELNG